MPSTSAFPTFPRVPAPTPSSHPYRLPPLDFGSNDDDENSKNNICGSSSNNGDGNNDSVRQDPDLIGSMTSLDRLFRKRDRPSPLSSSSSPSSSSASSLHRSQSIDACSPIRPSFDSSSTASSARKSTAPKSPQTPTALIPKSFQPGGEMYAGAVGGAILTFGGVPTTSKIRSQPKQASTKHAPRPSDAGTLRSKSSLADMRLMLPRPPKPPASTAGALTGAPEASTTENTGSTTGAPTTRPCAHSRAASQPVLHILPPSPSQFRTDTALPSSAQTSPGGRGISGGGAVRTPTPTPPISPAHGLPSSPTHASPSSPHSPRRPLPSPPPPPPAPSQTDGGIVTHPPMRGSSLPQPALAAGTRTRSPSPRARTAPEALRPLPNPYGDDDDDHDRRPRGSATLPPPPPPQIPPLDALTSRSRAEAPSLWVIPPSPGIGALTFAQGAVAASSSSPPSAAAAATPPTTGEGLESSAAPRSSSSARGSAESSRSTPPSLSGSASSRSSEDFPREDAARLGGTESSQANIPPARKSIESTYRRRGYVPPANRGVSIAEDPRGLGAAHSEAYPFTSSSRSSSRSRDGSRSRTTSQSSSSRTSRGSRTASPAPDSPALPPHRDAVAAAATTAPIYAQRARALAPSPAPSGRSSASSARDEEDEEEDTTLTSSFHIYERGSGSARTVSDLSRLPTGAAAVMTAVMGSDIAHVPYLPRRAWREGETSVVTARCVVDKGRARAEGVWEELDGYEVVAVLRDMKPTGWRALGYGSLVGWKA